MSFRPFSAIRLRRVALPLLSCFALIAGIVARPARMAAVAAEATAQATDSMVPPVPDGTPEELLAFVEALGRPQTPPRSRQERRRYALEASAAAVQAADRVLAQVQPTDAFHAQAARIKLDGLETLAAEGDAQAGKELIAFAQGLAAGPHAELAEDAALVLLDTEAQVVLSKGSFEDAADFIEVIAGKLAANADDTKAASLAIRFATALERVPGAERAAVAAHEAFVPLFEKSDVSQIRPAGAALARTLRWLSLPGKPMRIEGTLLDGAAFDPATLARHYGIRGIPQMILVGHDGNVITLHARGPNLAAELAKLFPAAE